MIDNHPDGYGWLSRALHWWMAVLIVGLFLLGLWMVELTYYHAWYQKAPWLHNGLGILMTFFLAIRIAWNLKQAKPSPLGAHWERLAASLIHAVFYILLIALVISGYFINTADGSGLTVFDVFEIPALLKLKGLEQWSGFVHRYSAYILIALVAVHTAAALKHHFVDRDSVLTRMLRG